MENKELIELSKIRALVAAHSKSVLVDNDFEQAYSVPHSAFDEFSKAILVEQLFIYKAIIEEMSEDEWPSRRYGDSDGA